MILRSIVGDKKFIRRVINAMDGRVDRQLQGRGFEESLGHGTTERQHGGSSEEKNMVCEVGVSVSSSS